MTKVHFLCYGVDRWDVGFLTNNCRKLTRDDLGTLANIILILVLVFYNTTYYNTYNTLTNIKNIIYL